MCLCACVHVSIECVPVFECRRVLMQQILNGEEGECWE